MNNLIKKDDEYILASDAIDSIYNIEKQINDLKKLQEGYKEVLLQEMEQVGATQIKNDKFMVSYVAPTTKETFDSKTFQKENKELYKKYVKISNVNSFIKIKLKEK